jgi:polyhydroxybutyrate depolymerase
MACGIASVVAAAGVVGLALWPRPPRRVASAGPQAGLAGACRPGEKTGAVALDDKLLTPSGLAVRVRTPADYDPTRAYPLLVAFPPAGAGRGDAEHYYGLTGEATRRGFVVAYSDHVPMSRQAMRMQAEVAPAVIARWCIRKDAVAYIGHSDGGSVAEGALILPAPGDIRPRAIVASAAGIAAADLQAASCSAPPLQLMISGNRGDEHFPGYAATAARHWAACAGCADALGPLLPSGCRLYQGCATGNRVAYCEFDGPHERWPPVADAALQFIQEANGR